MTTPDSIMDFRSLYNYLSGNYDQRQANPTTRAIRNVEGRLLGRHAKGLILDAGCGTGHYLGLPYSVGIDLSEGMLRMAKAKTSRLCQADICSLPFKNDSFGTYISMHSTINFCELGTAAREASRVLKPGGRAIITLASAYDNGFRFFGKLKGLGAARKRVKIEKRRFSMRLFSRQEAEGEFAKSGMQLIHFDSAFRMVNPQWGNFDRFPIASRMLLSMERLPIFMGLGCVYFFVFEKPMPSRTPRR